MSAISKITSTATNPANPVIIYLASLSPGSRRTMSESLEIAAAILSDGKFDAQSTPWWHLKYQHTTALRTLLAERYAPATANKIIAAVRRVLAESMRLGLMHPEDYAKASDIKRIKGKREISGRALSTQELAAIRSAIAADASPRGLRDLAIFDTLRLGLRRAEVANLQVSNYNSQQEYITVVGKGNKERVIFLSHLSVKSIKRWLGCGNFASFLFTPISKSGSIFTEKRLTPDGISSIILKHGQSAGVVNFSLHDFRRTFISNLFDAGVDVSTIQQLVGHSDPNTTTRYDRRGDKSKRDAINKIL